MRNGGAANDIILHILHDRTVFFRCQVDQHMANIGGIEAGGLRRHPAWKIGIANNRHAIVTDNFFVGFGQITIAATFSCQINDDRPRLHSRNHISQP